MKKLIFTLFTALSVGVSAQTSVCFNAPDGVENVWSGGWSYKQYTIPAGYKIDSVYANFDRAGYPASQEDFIFLYCAGSTFDAGTSESPFDYTTTNTSLYDHWIDLTSFDYNSTGIIQILLPINAGATWNDVCIAISPISNNIVCFNAPDGVENVWSGGWSYKDYVIPSGYKIDSVYADFDRNGYPVAQEDFIFLYSAGSVFDAGNSTAPFDYTTTNTSLYDHWIDLESFNYVADGVVEVLLPINAGGTWNEVCFAQSLITQVLCTQTVYDTVIVTNTINVYDTTHVVVSDTNFVTITDTNFVTVTDTNFVTVNDTIHTYVSVTDTLIIEASLGLPAPNETNIIKIFPNPASTHININTGNFALMNGYTIRIDNSLAQEVFTTSIEQQEYFVDLSTWSGNGTYFVYILDPQDNIVEVKKIVLQ